MSEPSDMRFAIHVHNRPGVLAKIAAAFHRRGLNIRTLTVAETAEPEFSTMAIGVSAGRDELERVALAIANFVDVISVTLESRNPGVPAG